MSLTNEERLKRLFDTELWSEEDRRWLLDYLETQDQEELRRLMDAHFQAEAAADRAHPPEAERLLTLIHERIQGRKDRPWILTLKKLAVAALVLLMAGSAILYFLPGRSPATMPPAVSGNAHDRPPGRNNALLTLADGRTITLDSAADGGLARQGNTQVIKLNGQIAYKDAGGAQALFNTISTANGNQYQLLLPDGTKAWLNAASSMRFPTAFNGKERRVEVTGEAYFEVAKNPAMPFTIEAGNGEIEVLGTHVDINAYPDEPTVKTTLLEGAVAVKRAEARQVLEPGQQAAFSAQGGITLSKNVDVARETAWKDGFFWFDNTDMHTLMRQVSRWYDVDVTFKGNIEDDGFSGKIRRDVPLSKFLKVLEQYDVHFTIEGRKITVQP
ncbi:FecR family protein [Dinghuibacter silviterrae]|uniref:FecR family protein n=1 Tax=Dinghuibacter silviterrae TaxID=1539049 RepID=A0A4R8DSQ2_9BACT|nr:FecR family protein [Dinghuibacter silviterrae]TDX00898.1 FecR family protein [Dinghuibacter silviterrae]